MESAPSTTDAGSGNLLSGGGAAPPAAIETQAVAPVVPSSAWTYADESGNLNDGWMEKAGFKDDPTLSTIKTVPTLAKAYKDTKAAYGQKVAPPTETSTPEQIAAWRKITGAPETADAYGSLMPEGFQKELWDGEMEKSFTELAHKHHLPPAAVKEIAALQANGTKAIYEREMAAVQQQLDAGRAELQKAWGPDYPRQEANVKALASFLGIPAEHDMFRDPFVMKTFAEKASAILGGDKIVHGSPMGVSGSMAERVTAIQRGDDYQGKNGPEAQARAADQLRRYNASIANYKAA